MGIRAKLAGNRNKEKEKKVGTFLSFAFLQAWT
jgi:hypothetical protein